MSRICKKRHSTKVPGITRIVRELSQVFRVKRVFVNDDSICDIRIMIFEELYEKLLVFQRLKAFTLCLIISQREENIASERLVLIRHSNYVRVLLRPLMKGGLIEGKVTICSRGNQTLKKTIVRIVLVKFESLLKN